VTDLGFQSILSQLSASSGEVWSQELVEPHLDRIDTKTIPALRSARQPRDISSAVRLAFHKIMTVI